MPRRQKTGPSKGSSKRLTNDEARSHDRLEGELSRVLANIAALLISSGYGYGKMSKLAKIAFIDAAIEICRTDRRKPSVAQIAAATGLTRTEISNIARQKSRSLSAVDSKNRSINVAAGWLSDPTYCTTKGVPRPLPFKGREVDFSSLVRKYSGDVPARAMLREMQRLGMVTSESGELLCLTRQRAPVTRANLRALGAIEPWVALIKNAVLGSEKKVLSADTSRLDLYFDSIPQVLAVLGDLKKRRLAFVQGLSELGGRSVKGHKYGMRINIAIAVARPIRAK
jgi:hypothetical protein